MPLAKRPRTEGNPGLWHKTLGLEYAVLKWYLWQVSYIMHDGTVFSKRCKDE